MTLQEIQSSDKTWLNAADIAEAVESDPNDIRWQAQNNPDKLGYPVSVCKHRVKIPRLGFLYFVKYGKAAPP